jgi:hypothetical protein
MQKSFVIMPRVMKLNFAPGPIIPFTVLPQTGTRVSTQTFTPILNIGSSEENKNVKSQRP